ncbi:MAG: urease accessory protein UreD [Pseudomonadota bacterium]
MSAEAVSLQTLQRAMGRARIDIATRDGVSHLQRLYQQGCAKVRMPLIEPGQPLQFVLLNTAGGLTDGDVYEVDVAWREASTAVVTTQAAERIYRSRGAPARVINRLTVKGDAVAVWLPQETILFDQGRCDRLTEVALKSTSAFLAMDSLVCGRKAMNEVVRHGLWFDRWRVRIDGRLVFADALRLASDEHDDFQALLKQPAISSGHQAVATGLVVGPQGPELRDQLRLALQECDVAGGVSQVGAVTCWRFLAADGDALRRASNQVFDAIVSVAPKENPFAGLALPRVFRC